MESGRLRAALGQFFLEPLRGNTPFGRVIWLYGIAGSLALSALGLLIDVTNERAMRVYSVLGLVYSIYVTIATYQCARNCRSVVLRRFVRVAAVLSLALLPLIAYLGLSGSLSLSSLGGEQ